MYISFWYNAKNNWELNIELPIILLYNANNPI